LQRVNKNYGNFLLRNVRLFKWDKPDIKNIYSKLISCIKVSEIYFYKSNENMEVFLQNLALFPNNT